MGLSARLSFWFVPTPPYSSFSRGANIHGRRVDGHVTSSSAKTVIDVVMCGIALTIWRRLFGCATLRVITLLVFIFLIILFARSRLASIVTRMISWGSVARMLNMVSSRPSPPRDGMTTVTSLEVKRGFSGMGMGRRARKAKTLTIRRRYR